MKSCGALAAITISCLAAALSACASAPATPAETYQGTMSSGCAPHDAPSTVIDLQSVEADTLVSFNLWPSAGIAPPSTVEFDAQHPIGQGAICSGAGDCEPAAWGKVVLESPPKGGDASVGGEWTIGLADGRIYRGLFTAEWLTIQALCG
jgi:hypothetical protein